MNAQLEGFKKVKFSQRFLIYSLLSHFFVLAILYYLGQDFFSNNSLDLKNLKVIKSSIKVDVVALPKLTLKELKSIKFNEPAKQNLELEKEKIQNIKADDVILKKKRKKKDFMDMLKGMSKNKIKTQNKIKPQKKQDLFSNLNDKNLKKLMYMGNKLSQGASATGEQLASASGSLLLYQENIRGRIKEFWQLPGYLINQGYSCHIQLFINRDGTLKKTKILKSSGNKMFDEKAVLAVKNASPFNEPPQEISKLAFSGKIVFAFPL